MCEQDVYVCARQVCFSDSDVYTSTIVIDAGKTFQAAAVEWFPKVYSPTSYLDGRKLLRLWFDLARTKEDRCAANHSCPC